MTIIGKLISRLGERIANVFKSIFHTVEHIDVELKELAEKALVITTNIKIAINSPYAEIALSVIPGEWDRATRDAISATLDIINGWLGEELKDMHPKKQNAMLIMIASKITADLDGNKLLDNQYDAIVQNVYSARVGENKAG